MKGFSQTERSLRAKIQEIEQKDEQLLHKMEEALCFGKIMFTSKPVIVKGIKALKSNIQKKLFDKLSNNTTLNNNSK